VTTPGSNSRARSVAPAAVAVLALIATATIGGCFVSFDGYQLGNNGGDAGASALGGRTNQNPGGAAGMTILNGSDAGAPANGGTGEVGAAPNGGDGNASSGAPNGGASSAGAGDAPNGGASSAGAGDAPNGGAGKAGAGGSGGVMQCPAGTTNRASQEVPLVGGGFYCIDHAEVRNADYKAFVDAQANTAGQIAACAFNNDYAPDIAGPCDQYDPVSSPDLPIACVDWCDAAAFCKWDGKHLCGKLGGGSNTPADFADPTKSAWYRACSHAGDFDFPYGNSYNGNKCAGLDNATAVHPFATPFTSCVGGYDGLYDMSGNVAEWEDSCSGNAGAADLCLDRGGSYLDTNVSVGAAPSLQCNSNVHGSPKMAMKARSTRSPEIGFRCCSEAVPGLP
jgi:sulfatase modifying factor 1